MYGNNDRNWTRHLPEQAGLGAYVRDDLLFGSRFSDVHPSLSNNLANVSVVTRSTYRNKYIAIRFFGS